MGLKFEEDRFPPQTPHAQAQQQRPKQLQAELLRYQNKICPANIIPGSQFTEPTAHKMIPIISIIVVKETPPPPRALLLLCEAGVKMRPFDFPAA